MKNSSDTIGNRTRDLPACSAVPQSTAPPRTPCIWIGEYYIRMRTYVHVGTRAASHCTYCAHGLATGQCVILHKFTKFS